jgi:hypothetical protein
MEMVWILIFVLNGDPVASPVFYYGEQMCEMAVEELVKEPEISRGYCFSVQRKGIATPID